MILWQKLATADWVASNETRLEEIAGLNLALIATSGRARISVEVSCRRRALVAQLIREFGGTAKTLPDDWWKSFSSTHPPIRIGRRLQIVSKPLRHAAGPAALVIPAAGTFGTGEHPTTAMALRLLEAETDKFSVGWRLLDAGTGSGILALAARKLGAAATLGLDNDPRAITIARDNARLNRINRARFAVVDILRFESKERYEAITANLFSELLIAALPVFRRSLAPNGLLFLSGILREHADSVVAALERERFKPQKLRRRGKWVAISARKKTRSGGLKTAAPGFVSGKAS